MHTRVNRATPRNTDGDDGCAADCSAPDDGYVCVRPGEPCVEISVCGNGVREGGHNRANVACTLALRYDAGLYVVLEPGAALEDPHAYNKEILGVLYGD